MMKLRLLFVTALLYATAGFSQTCVPSDFDWSGYNSGISPDPTWGQNVAAGTIGEPYSQVMYLKCPATLGMIIDDPIFSDIAVDSLRINSVNILTDMGSVSISEIGLNLTCNNNGESSNSCTFFPGGVYCGDISGVPTEIGEWPLSINITVFFNYIINQEISDDYDGYTLTVSEAPQETVNVTFKVNMQNETVSADGVHLAGNFQGWNPGSIEMTDDDGDDIYEVTVEIASGAIQYKFVNGNAWGSDESVPEACANDNNRFTTVGNEDVALAVVCYGECDNCEEIVEPDYVNITFKVNMQNETVSANGVHLVGNFQGWNPGSMQMTDGDEDGIYEFTAQVEAGSSALFKFINGDDWGAGEESVPGECGEDNGFGAFNRVFTVGESDAVYGPVCFSSCEDCEGVVEPTLVNVTFRVNMQNEDVSADGVHLAGNFQEWNPGSIEMTDGDGDGIYEVTVEITSGAIQYKFVNGNAWGFDESVPEACANDNNRFTTIGNEDVALVVVCYGECDNCEEIVEPSIVNVTFKVNMQNETVSADGVHLAGNFQEWNPGSIEMTDGDGDGIYEVTVEIASGAIQYKFVNGNAWDFDESVPEACADDNNRFTTIGNEDVSLAVVCYGECDNCEEIVEPDYVNVTFKVNMQNETVSADGVHLAGSLQGWNPESSEMTDDDGDGIYEITLPAPVNSMIEFKFLNGNSWGAGIQEIVPAGCGIDDNNGGYNRIFEVGTSDLNYGPVCFASCENCPDTEPVLITLRVDMENETVSSQGVFVAGSFNGWDPAATQMSEYEPGRYEAVIVMNSGTTYQYKFLNGNDWPGAESVPSECGEDDNNGGFNRFYTAGSVAETLTAVCFNQCSECVEIQMVEITIAVNMANETVSSSGVHLAGTFNDFSPSATQMALVSGSVYAATVTVPANTEITYKFINGNDFEFVESVPFECGVDDGFGGYNRHYTVASSSVSLPQVCFSSCADCVSGIDEQSIASLLIYPNPATDKFYIDLNGNAGTELFVYDMTGRVVYKNTLTSGHLEIDASGWSNGIYRIVIPGAEQQSVLIQK